MPFCRKCGNALEPSNKFCKVCGTPVPENKAQNVPQNAVNTDSGDNPTFQSSNNKNICMQCGKELNPNLKYCMFCGTPVQQPNQQTNVAPNAQNSYNAPQQFYQQQTYNQPSVSNAQYTAKSSVVQEKKNNKTMLIVIISAAVLVLVAAIVVLGVLFLPKMLNGSDSNFNGQNDIFAHVFEEATEPATEVLTDAVTESPTEPATEAPTNPPTEAPTVAQNDKPYDQYVEVVSSGTSATLTLYEWRSGEWQSIMSTNATVGQNGVGTNYGEGKKITPKGTFNLGFCYGLNKPVTNLEFKQVRNGSVFVSDSSSKYYNCLVTTNEYNGSNAENTYKQFAQDGTYSCNIFIEHNGDGETPNTATPGKGSVITICGYNGTLKPTWGCIDITSSDMTKLLTYLDSSKNPVIIIS